MTDRTAERLSNERRLSQLETMLGALERWCARADETHERLLRENRQLRARLDQYDEQERWIANYRADHA